MENPKEPVKTKRAAPNGEGCGTTSREIAKVLEGFVQSGQHTFNVTVERKTGEEMAMGPEELVPKTLKKCDDLDKRLEYFSDRILGSRDKERLKAVLDELGWLNRNFSELTKDELRKLELRLGNIYADQMAEDLKNSHNKTGNTY